jgi:DNA polymerase-3 subunit gamma/tau
MHEEGIGMEKVIEKSPRGRLRTGSNMEYQVVARRFRPQRFEDIVGQESTVQTLKNAITMNRIAHAYLFSGPRGIGKTTIARIYAKALNCKEGPTEKPCGKCPNCVEIAQGGSLDVLEIDGASNRGIDQIRDLKENVKYAPAGSRFKIYIIDEVHMLTNEAFNALLKTLEEPPAHIKFFFATTEQNKLPATILSRCQKFELRRITSKDIVSRLVMIAGNDGIQIDEDSLAAVARAGLGSMRDSESVLEQLISYCGKKITYDKVSETLGIVEDDTYFEIAGAVNKEDMGALIGIVERIADDGKDFARFLAGLTGHFRALLIRKIAQDDRSLFDMPKETLKKLSQQEKQFSEEELCALTDLCAKTELELKQAISVRVVVEMALIKMAKVRGKVSIHDLIGRVERLSQGFVMPAPAPKGAAGAGCAPAQPAAAGTEKQQAEMHRKPADKVSLGPDKDILRIHDAWADIILEFAKEHPMVKTFLAEGRILGYEDGTLIVGFTRENMFHKEALSDKPNLVLVQKKLSEKLGREIRLHLDLIEDDQKERGKHVRHVVRPEADVQAPKNEDAHNHPHVKEVLDIFEGKVVRVKK